MSEEPRTEDHSGKVAIIGLAGRFPGAANIDEFWRNLAGGVESVRRFTPTELIAAGVPPEIAHNPKYVPMRAALPGADLFDAEFFGYSPKEAEIMDPQHRVFLECAWEALENAGYGPGGAALAAGVFAGCGVNNYLAGLPVAAHTPALAYQRFILNDKDFLSTRVSYELNLLGPSVTVQTACSTGLVAVHLACEALLGAQCQIALAGGVGIQPQQDEGYLYQEGMILSADGHCRPFDAKAGGTIPGSGAGVVVLKRLEDALAAGDFIYAVILGTAINNDGASKVGYTAPSVSGQAAAIALAHAVANVSAETISYVETHGTGTRLGDPVEIAALTEAFHATAQGKHFCAIGSAKANIGHLDTAAGITGLIKTALALKHRYLPPSLNFEEPNPQIDFANSPFYVNTKGRDWPATSGPRRAGVSSFGIGGTNAHAVLEEAPPEPAQPPGRAAELLVLSAKSPGALSEAAQRLAAHLKDHQPALADVAFTLQAGRAPFKHRRAVLCHNLDEAVQALTAATGWSGVEPDEHKVAFVFGDQGLPESLLAELARAEPAFKQELAASSASPNRRFAGSLALAKLLNRWGVKPANGKVLTEPPTTATANLRELLQDASLFMLEIGPHAELRRLLAERHEETRLIAFTGAENTPRAGSEVLYAALAELWVRGVEIDWTAVNEGGRRRRIALPAYPFERKSYWAYRKPAAAATTALAEPVGERTQNANGEVVFSSLFSLAKMPSLKDHRVFDRLVVAGMCHVARVLRAADELFGEAPHVLREVSFQQPLVLADDEECVVRIVFSPVAAGGYAFRIESGDARGSPIPTVHASGFLGQGGPQVAPEVELAAAQKTCTEGFDLHITPELKLGPRYLWMREIKRGDGEALCLLRERQPHDELETYRVPPGLFDNCTGAVLAANGFDFEVNPHLYVPISFSELRVVRSVPPGPLWCVGVRHVLADAANMEGDFRLCDAHGRMIAVCKGFRLRRAPKQAMLSEKGLRWHHELVWQPARAPALPAERPAPSHWLVVDAGSGLGSDLARALKTRRLTTTLVEGDHAHGASKADSVEHARAIVAQARATGPLAGVIYLAGQAPIDDALLAAEPTLGCATLLAWLHALVAAEENARLVVVTAGAQPLGDGEVSLAQAPLWGLARVIDREHPELRCTAIDLAVGDTKAAKLEALADELLVDDGEHQVALRPSGRLVLRLARRPAPNTPPPSLDKNGSYLLTGGLGGLGRVLARHLATRGAGCVVLASRQEPGAEARALAEEMAGHQCRAVFMQADVGKRADVVHLLDQLRATCPPLRGVVHLAGVLADGVLSQQNRERFGRVMQPKVAGAWYLDQLTRQDTLDFFVLFSSLSSVVGAAGQSNYAAANAFLDALAHERRRQGLPAVAINWGPWDEVGMAVRTAGVRERLRAQGLEMLRSDEALQTFDSLAAPGERAQVVIAKVDWDAYAGADPASARLLMQLVRAPEAKKSKTTPKLAALTSAPVEQRRDLVMAHVWAQVADVLGLDANTVADPRQPLRDLGLDSLLAIEVRNRLSAEFEQPLPATLVFDYPSLGAISSFVAERMAGNAPKRASEPAPRRSEEAPLVVPAAIDALSDEEVTRELARELDGLDDTLARE